MRFKVVLVLLLVSLLARAQGEANIWYFGEYAGLDFSSGSPVALTDGQLLTTEGCASICNANGVLLFYTEGSTVYNSNHQIMVNGTDLYGHSSSTQSATIVPKPGSNTLYYIFTLDQQAGTRGLRFSTVDISLDGGLGAVENKNVLIYAPSCEKMGLIKHANGTDYWIVTHERNSNHFVSHRLTANGIESNPTISAVAVAVMDDVNTGNSGTQGFMKISNDGSKLAYASIGLQLLQLFDFNIFTGSVSNPITLLSGFTQMYGIEFSPNSKVLYHSNINNGILYQFNLEAANIPASVVSFNYGNSNIVGALQLGPDKKIYMVNYLSNKLSVINNPNVVGSGCNFQFNSIVLDTGYVHKGTLGLPSFNQSFFFTPTIQLQNACVGEATSFQFNTNQTVTTANWNFGDGTVSTDLNPNHLYNVAGNYSVSVTITTPNGTGINSRNITIYDKPTLLNTSVSLKQCDDNNDGFSAFNLKEAAILLVTNPTVMDITFYETLTEAQNATNEITNATNYTNQVVSNDVVYVRVENANGCYRTAQLNLNVSTTLIPNSFQLVYNECDDLASGSNTDGISSFDFSNATSQIAALYPAGQALEITFYKNIADALAETNKIINTTSYVNTNYPVTQDIYVRVDSQINNECLGLGHHITLKVDRIPIVQPQIIRNCDDDQDNIFSFDTSTVQTSLLNGLTNVVVTYTDQNNLPITMTNPFPSISQTLNVKVKNTFGKLCEYTTTLQFIVDDLPEAFTIPVSLTTVCDDEDDPTLQNGIFPFDTSTFQSTLLGNQTGMIVNYYDSLNNLLPSPLPNPFNSSTQNIKIVIQNQTNTYCSAITTVPLQVLPMPKIILTGSELICSNNSSFVKTIDAGLLDLTTLNNYNYTWYLDGILIPNEINYSLTVNTEGIYTVQVATVNNCVKTRTITVTASNTATITNVTVSDLSNENSIEIFVTGAGIYTYSLDGEIFQENSNFTNLLPGIYTIYVKDTNGCGIAKKDVSVLGVPTYFTPNGDGFNDYWNIKGVNENFNSKAIIHIFDRFGKLLKQISSLSAGWDGKYNNELQLSEDYWYVIQLEDGRTSKGHFSLKR